MATSIQPKAGLEIVLRKDNNIKTVADASAAVAKVFGAIPHKTYEAFETPLKVAGKADVTLFVVHVRAFPPKGGASGPKLWTGAQAQTATADQMAKTLLRATQQNNPGRLTLDKLAKFIKDTTGYDSSAPAQTPSKPAEEPKTENAKAAS